MPTTTIADLSFTAFAGDYIIIIAFFTIVCWYALMRGIGLVGAATVALPLTLFLYEIGLTSQWLGSLFTRGITEPATGVAVFVVLFMGLYLTLYRAFSNTTGGSYSIIRAMLAGGALTGMALAVWQQFYPTTLVWTFGPEIARYFTSEYFFWWILGSITLLCIASLTPTEKKSPTHEVTKKSDQYAAGVRYN